MYASLDHTKAAAAQRALKNGKPPPPLAKYGQPDFVCEYTGWSMCSLLKRFENQYVNN